MSLLSSLLLDLIDQPIDGSFGFGLYPENVFLPVMRRTPSIYNARWQPFLRSAQNHRDNKRDKSLESCVLNKVTVNAKLIVPLLRE